MSYFSPVDSVLKNYHNQYDLTKVPISVDELRGIFEKIGYVDVIRWEEFDYKTRYILGQIKTFKANMGVYAEQKDYARIQISKGQNPCWKRFVICKEMYHTIIDATNKARIANTDDLLKLSNFLSNSFLSQISKQQVAYDPYDTEVAAEIFALETLFPYELRRNFCDDYDKGIITDHQLALRFKIPEVYIAGAMSSDYFTAVYEGRELVNI